MKKYSSVWITKILKEDPTREVWDISVKMNARIKAAHFEKESKEEAEMASKQQPAAIDVYKGKTTLRVTYIDSIATDSVVVFKGK